MFFKSECSAVWLAYLFWKQDVVGSNPTTQTIKFGGISIMGIMSVLHTEENSSNLLSSPKNFI